MALISMQTSPWYDVKNTDPEYLDETFKMVRDSGIEAIDFNFGSFLNVKIFNEQFLSEVDGFFEKTEEELIEFFRPVKEAAEKNSLAFSQAHAPFPVAVYGEEEKNNYMVMVTEKCLAVSKFLGCPALVIHPPKDEDKSSGEMSREK